MVPVVTFINFKILRVKKYINWGWLGGRAKDLHHKPAVQVLCQIKTNVLGNVPLQKKSLGPFASSPQYLSDRLLKSGTLYWPLYQKASSAVAVAWILLEIHLAPVSLIQQAQDAYYLPANMAHGAEESKKSQEKTVQWRVMYPLEQRGEGEGETIRVSKGSILPEPPATLLILTPLHFISYTKVKQTLLRWSSPGFMMHM